MTDQNQKIAVTIAGNDSDGSAGMPADLHSFFARGVYGMGLLTLLLLVIQLEFMQQK